MNSAKHKLATGKLVLCMGVRQIRSPDVALLAAECGFDALFVDMEHSAFTLESASAVCAGALRCGAACASAATAPMSGKSLDWRTGVR